MFLDIHRQFKSISYKRLLIIIQFCFLPLVSQAQTSNFVDSDKDGLSDQYERKLGTEAYLADTDGDGISDGIEVGPDLNNPLDTDGDKRLNVFDYDDDNDGLPSILEAKTDADKDGLLNYLDPDSDNDGITDGLEAGMQMKDANHDFIDDAFNIKGANDIDKNGDGIADNLKLPDINNNNIPDYMDASFINDPKNPHPKITSKRKKNKDSDNDGLNNDLEIRLGTNPYKRDTDGDKVSDAIEIGLDINHPQDSDQDNKIDALDPDDDNDGILTKNEDLNKDGTPINDDTDDDGIPNYLDVNDDGDGRLTINEGGTNDTDKDGVLDYLDNDGSKETNITHQTIVNVAPIPAAPSSEIQLPKVVLLPDVREYADSNIDNNQPKTNEGSISISLLQINETINISKPKAIDSKANDKDQNSIITWLASLLPN